MAIDYDAPRAAQPDELVDDEIEELTAQREAGTVSPPSMPTKPIRWSFSNFPAPICPAKKRRLLRSTPTSSFVRAAFWYTTAAGWLALHAKPAWPQNKTRSMQ